MNCYLAILAGYDVIIRTCCIQCKHIRTPANKKNKSRAAGSWLPFSNKHATQSKLDKLFILLNILWRKSQVLDYVLTDFVMFHLFVLFLKLKTLTRCELSDLRESLLCVGICFYTFICSLCWGIYPLKWFLPPLKEPLFLQNSIFRSFMV